MKQVGENLILVQFFHRLDKQRVMEGSPWSFDKQLLILKEYDGDTQPSEIDLKCSPFWIQIHNLPFNQMEKGMGEAIGRKCGEVLELDVNGDGIGWGRCLRVRVLLDVSMPLKRGTMVHGAGSGPHWVHFQYERLTNFCYRCGVVGHHFGECEMPAKLDKVTGKEIYEYGPWMRAQAERKFGDRRNRET
ncbi:hypothetical protein RJ640_024497 [Escallonia rubra]|uniref:CCHC-type domain-containing protein n=1 Tax=Escallonia rubra TaxID=112253 RepID=A0AA88RBH8_9ASTE|nr:hypothetical protein RJ640_024497 [Escallonia rubra]